MNTRSPISTISYNSEQFLIRELNKLIDNKVIEFFAFVYHIPEEDEKKSHRHLFIIPSSQIDTFVLNTLLEELDVDHPDLPPLRCINWCHSKFVDWYLYALHDRDYLASKQESRVYHYSKDDIVCSDWDYMNELIHRSDFSKYKVFAKFRESISSGVSFRELFSNGFIPVQQIIQWKKGYNLLRYGCMDIDEHTIRAGRAGHESTSDDYLPFKIVENGEIIPYQDDCDE